MKKNKGFCYIATDNLGNRLTFVGERYCSITDLQNTQMIGGSSAIAVKSLDRSHYSNLSLYLMENYIMEYTEPDYIDRVLRALENGHLRLVSIEYGAQDKEASAELRLAIKQTLTNIVLQTSVQAKIEQEVFGQESTISKGLIYVGAFMHGVSQSATDLASWLKDVNNAFNPIMQLCSAFEIALQKDDSSSFIDQLSEDQRHRNVQALGFDPNNISLDQLKEAIDILTTIYQDPALQEAIKQFCIDYVKAQHSVRYFHVGGSAVFEVILSAVLIALTAGAGLGVRAASMGNKTRLFKELGELLVDFAKRNQKHKKPHAEQKATYSYEQAVFEPARLRDYQAEVGLTPRSGNRVHKRVHPDGKQPSPTDKYGDPYTLQADGKPLGAKAGVMPNEHMGLKKLTPEQTRLIKDEGYPDLIKNEDFKNFSSLEPHTLKPGDTVYRIIDEKAGPAGGYWASELPANKTEWRSQYAVKDSWNDNGYYVKHTVPEGQEEIQVWKGKTAGQQYKEHNGKDFYLEGGNEQIYMTPGTLDKQPLTPQLTNWPEI